MSRGKKILSLLANNEIVNPVSLEENTIVPKNTNRDTTEWEYASTINKDKIIILSDILVDPKVLQNSSENNTTKNHKEIDLSETSTDVEQVYSETANLDYRILNISASKSHCKRYFCTFCGKLVTNFGRHLLSVHQLEPKVREIVLLPKGSAERHKSIEILRREAQFKHNVDPNINTGSIIVKRRPTELKNRSVVHYMPCPSCKEMFSKLSLRVHYKKCKNTNVDNPRSIFVKSKQVQMYIHNTASPRLKFVLSRSKNDEITSVFAYDELAILYGNKLTRKFKNERHDSMIRSRLREIGKFLINFKKRISDVASLYDVFQPIHYDNIVDVINEVAGLNNLTGRYRAPSTAYSLGLHIKEIAVLLHAECIKKGNGTKKAVVEDLISLMREGFQTDINKTVGENQSEIKRHKKISLPTAEDIKALKQFLENGRRSAYVNLKDKFSRDSWKKLADMSLLSLQLFNRRRAGELETILIADYKTCEFVNKNDITFQSLSEEAKVAAEHFARFFIRGKKNARPVPVIISKELIQYIDIMLKYRATYGVPHSNPYVFGTRGEVYNSHLRACQLMRYYSQVCGAPNPERLRGTELRKQIATACALYNLTDPMVEDIANHLGHHVDIHKKIYRQSTARELPAVAEVLLKALGEDLENENDEVNLNIQKYSETNAVLLENQKFSDGVTATKRVSWSATEKETITKNFSEHIEEGTVPTYAECRQVQQDNSSLSKRTPPQMKSFIAYQTKKKRTPPAKSQKRSWSVAEQQVVRRELHGYVSSGKLPSLPFCKEVITKNPILSQRKPATLKAHINNLIKKNKNK